MINKLSGMIFMSHYANDSNISEIFDTLSRNEDELDIHFCITIQLNLYDAYYWKDKMCYMYAFITEIVQNETTEAAQVHLVTKKISTKRLANESVIKHRQIINANLEFPHFGNYLVECFISDKEYIDENKIYDNLCHDNCLLDAAEITILKNSQTRGK